MNLKPWREVAVPHEDAAGRRLGQVAVGGQRPDEQVEAVPARIDDEGRQVRRDHGRVHAASSAGMEDTPAGSARRDSASMASSHRLWWSPPL